MEKNGVGLAGGFCLQPGDQTPKTAENGGSGAAGAGGSSQPVSGATLPCEIERADQHIVRGAVESDHPAVCEPIDTPYVGTSAVHTGTDRTPRMVEKLLSLRPSARESGRGAVQTGPKKRKTATPKVPEADSGDGGRVDGSKMDGKGGN